MIGLLAILVGAGVAANYLIPRGRKLIKLNEAGKKLEVVNSLMLHKIDFKGITIRVDVNLKNPSEEPVTIKFPFVKLQYKGATIGTSQVVDRSIPIPKWGEAVAEGIMIKIPYKGVFSLGGGLVEAIESGEAVKITTVAQTSIDMGKDQKPFPYEITEEVTLKSA